jgi:ADP-ribose pyrophosphatase
MKRPKVLEKKTVFKGFFDVCQDLIQRADGETFTYTHFVLPVSAVVVLGQTADGLFVLNREYRHPIGNDLLGCPGGRLEPGEDPLVGGLREFQEETGYTSDEIEQIGVSYPFPGLCNQKIYFLSAKNAKPLGKQSLDPFEFIQPELKTEAELHAVIARGDRVDGLLITALGYRMLQERS